MTGTFQGFGTTQVGESDRRSDGSYVTSEWLMIFSLPVIPLRSMRVRPIEYKDEHSGPIMTHTLRYEILQRLPLQWGQVARVYAAFAAFVTLVGAILAVALTHHWDQTTLMIVMGAVVGTAIVFDKLKGKDGKHR